MSQPSSPCRTEHSASEHYSLPLPDLEDFRVLDMPTSSETSEASDGEANKEPEPEFSPEFSLHEMHMMLSALECGDKASKFRQTHFGRVFKPALLIMMPIVASFRAIMFRWATGGDEPQFPIFLVLLVVELCVTLIVSSVLVARYGWAELRTLADRSYCVTAIAGFPKGMKTAVEMMALTHVGADLFLVLIKTAIVPTIVIDSIYKGRLIVGLVESMLVLILLLQVLQYALPSILSGADNSDVLGIGLCLLSTLISALGDTTFSMSVRRQQAKAGSESGCEKLRCYLMMQLGKLVGLTPVMLILEWDQLVTDGVSFLFDWHVVIGIILPTIARTMIGNFGISFCGAFNSNLALTLDMATAYAFEEFIRERHLGNVKGINIVTLTVVVMCFAFLSRKLAAERAAARKATLGEVRSGIPEPCAARVCV